MATPTLFDTGIFSVTGLQSELLIGAKLYWYVAGTTTPTTTYADPDLSIPNANPVLANNTGRFPEIWLGAGSYKYLLVAPDGTPDTPLVSVDDYEPIAGVFDQFVSDLAGPGGIELVGGLEEFARTAFMATLTDAKASDILPYNPTAQFIHIADRDCSFQRWQPPMITLPDTLGDYAWFEDAGGNLWMIPPGTASVINFGATGGDSTADTRGFFAAAAWCSSGYCHDLVIPNVGTEYLLKDGLLAWYPTGAAKTEMTSIPNFAGPNCGIAFIGIDGLTIRGEGFPTVKRADDGCTLNTFSWLSWGVFNFKSCTSATVTGINLDCNRLGQFYTSGLSTFTDANHGLFFWGDCQKPTVKFCDISNTGTLHTNADKAGDGVYMSSGTKDRLITYCKFYTMGRMAITMERPRPNTSTNDDTTQSYRDEISNYYIDNEFNQDGAVALAGIDYEPWSTFGYVRIYNGIHKGSAKISIGSAGNAALQVVRDIHIHDLVFDLTGSTGAHDSDVLINISAGWTNPSLSLTQTVRIYEGVTIEDIDVYSDKKLGGHIIQFQTAVFRDLTVKNVRNHARDSTVVAVSAITFSSAWLEGTVDLDSNLTGQITQGIHFVSWQDPTTYGYTADTVRIFIRHNIGNGTARGIRGSLPAFPSGSAITIGEGNRFPNQTSQSDPNASTMTGVSGNTAKVLQKLNYFSGTGNSFTGFTTPGQGLATILNGNSSVTVTHGLGYTPTNINVTLKGTPPPNQSWGWDSAGTTTFVIKTATNVGADTVFSWDAVGPGGL